MMSLSHAVFGSFFGLLALSGTQASAAERHGITVEAPADGSLLNPKNLSKEIGKLGPMKVLKVHSVEKPLETFDTKSFEPDTSGFGEVCFTSVSPRVPYQLSLAEGDVFVRAMTCEKRDSIVKALGLASVFMKGTSYACAFLPVPQVQLTAKVIDIASYATSSVALVISVTKCENTMEAKFNAVIKACEDLRTMGVDCQGVDNEPF